MNFNQLGVSSFLCSALEKLNITVPTPVQEAVIPALMQGKDILASAQTGTGKTYSYLLPLIDKMEANENVNTLVLVPTRELAIQVRNNLQAVARHIKYSVIIGGEPMFKQLKELRSNPRVVIGTPGRINDHLSRRTLDLTNFSCFVIDEMDRMLDMGFIDSLDSIVERLPENRQTIMLSATISTKVAKLCQRYQKDAQKFLISSPEQTATSVTQEHVKVSRDNKTKTLIEEINKREGAVIVFVKTKMKAQDLSFELRDSGISVDALHGDLRQTMRRKVITKMKENKIRVLIATDVAARGLDIAHIKHVVNYDLPTCIDDYVHRIGRTSRAGAEGFALSLVSPDERRYWSLICRKYCPTCPNQDPADKRDSRGGDDSRFERRFGRDGGGSRGGFGGRSGGSRGGFGGGDRPSFPRRNFGGGDRPERSFGGDRPERSFGGDRPERSFDRPFKRSFGGDRPERSFGDRPERSFDRPQRSFGDKPAFGGGFKPRFEGRGENSFGGDRAEKPRSFESRVHRAGQDRFANTDKFVENREFRKFDRDGGSFGGGEKPAFRRFDKFDKID